MKRKLDSPSGTSCLLHVLYTYMHTHKHTHTHTSAGQQSCLMFGSEAFVFIFGCSDSFCFSEFPFITLKKCSSLVEGNKNNDFSRIQGVDTDL